jgi:hypothetical protein
VSGDDGNGGGGTATSRGDDSSYSAAEKSSIILEGRQVTTIHCGSLLGPVHVVGGSKAVDALGGTPPPSAFLPRNRRKVSDSVACDKDGVPYPIKGSIKERFDPRLRIERGVKESMRYLDKKHVRSILDAVLRVRGERLFRRMTSMDSYRSYDVDTYMEDATTPRAADLRHRLAEYFGLDRQLLLTQRMMIKIQRRPEHILPYVQSSGMLIDVTIDGENYGWGIIVRYKRKAGTGTSGCPCLLPQRVGLRLH